MIIENIIYKNYNIKNETFILNNQFYFFHENLINLKLVNLNNYARLIEQILIYIKIISFTNNK